MPAVEGFDIILSPGSSYVRKGTIIFEDGLSVTRRKGQRLSYSDDIEGRYDVFTNREGNIWLEEHEEFRPKESGRVWLWEVRFNDGEIESFKDRRPDSCLTSRVKLDRGEGCFKWCKVHDQPRSVCG